MPDNSLAKVEFREGIQKFQDSLGQAIDSGEVEDVLDKASDELVKVAPPSVDVEVLDRRIVRSVRAKTYHVAVDVRISAGGSKR